MGSTSRFLRNKVPTFIRNFIYDRVPFGNRYGSLFKKVLSDLLINECRHIYDLHKEQNENLHRFIEHAYNNTIYYKRILNERGLRPDDINGIRDLYKLPIITREEIKKNFNLMCDFVNFYGSVDILKTSGSMGSHLEVKISKKLYQLEAAFQERAYNSHDGTLYFGKSVWLRRYCPNLNEPLWYEDKEQQRLYMSAYHITKDNLKMYVDAMNKYGAPNLSAYPSSAYVLAYLMKESNLKLKYITNIHTSSEYMPKEWIKVIEEVLDVPVRDHYGMLEHVAFHHKCCKGVGYHDNLDYGVTEVDKDGCVVATGFLNSYMPLIRYKLSDIAIYNQGNSQCSCGSNLPLFIQEFQGRSEDILVTKDGRYLPPVSFFSRLGKVVGLQMFKIEQVSIDIFNVSIISNSEYTEDTYYEVEEVLKDRIGRDNRINIIKTDCLDRDTKTGKIRCIVNNYKRI